MTRLFYAKIKMIININELNNQNPHWFSKNILECEFTIKRDLYFELEKWVQEPEGIVIEGLRRTGKSTLLKQLRDRYLQIYNIPSSAYLLLTFENDESFDLLPTSVLEESLDLYFRSILNSHVTQYKHEASLNRILIHLDEIQNVKGWSNVIKKYYDLNKNIKFLISGSSSLFVNDELESLVGRTVEATLLPLNFSEFLKFSGQNFSLPRITKINDLTKVYPSYITREQLNWFEKFLLCGGFPEVAERLNRDFTVKEMQDYIRNTIIKRIITKDLKRYFNVKDTIKDLTLFKILCNETGSEINIQNIAKDTLLDEDTVKLHLDIFKRTHLISFLNKFETKLRRQVRGKRKCYVNSPSIIYSALGIDNFLDSNLNGHVIESYAFMQISKLCEEMYYAQDVMKKEIDFYLPKEKIMIESKFGETFKEKEFKFLIGSAEKFKCKAVVVTKDRLEIAGEPEIVCVPCLYF